MTRLQKIVLLIFLCSAAQTWSRADTSPSNSASAATPKQRADTSSLGFTGEKVRLIGRFDLRRPGQARFTWPGSALEFRFKGASAGIRIASNDRIRFYVEVDGEGRELWVTQGERVYTIASGLEPGIHLARLTRLSESFSGVTALTSDPLVEGTLLAPPEPPGRRLLVLGNSITAGYGVDGESESCGYSMETSDPLKTYASLAAAALDADLHIIAWSGIGAWRSYGEKSPENPTIIDRYPLALADDFDSHWDPADFRPDAVLVNIGTNDYWDGKSPGYATAMKTLLETVRKDYSETPVYLIVSSMLTGSVREKQKSVLESFTGESIKAVDLGRIKASEGYGCDYHPNVKTQSRMADALIEHLEAGLGW